VPERATVSSRSEKSAEAVVVGGKAAKPTHRRRAEREGVFNTMPMWRALRQMPAQAGRLEEGRGEAESYSGSDEARRPRHRSESTGSSRHLNLLNRPVRTRMPGGVGGEGPQGSPLSRSVIIYAGLWLAFDRATFDWNAVATLAVFVMTLFIQRANRRDNLALHAKLDELLRVDNAARSELTQLVRRNPR
jgi:hypothetical protein